jgi:hypothetical protein
MRKGHSRTRSTSYIARMNSRIITLRLSTQMLRIIDRVFNDRTASTLLASPDKTSHT